MLRKLLNGILLVNGVSSLDEKNKETKEDKWAARRMKFGERPWEEQRPPIPNDAASDNPVEPPRDNQQG